MAKRVTFDFGVDSGNDSVVDCPAIRIAEMLEEAARKLRTGSDVTGKIRDVNGNAIGRIDFFVE